MEAERRAKAKKRTRLITRIAGGVVVAAASGLAYYYDNSFTEKEGEADDIYTNYQNSGRESDWKDYGDKLKESESAGEARNIFFAVAGAGAAVIGVSFAF